MKINSVIRTLCLAAAAMLSLAANAQTTVIDNETEEPVTYASVFDKTTGKYLGNTDGSGQLPEKAETAGTISLQHINYETTTVEMASVEGGKIRLAPQVHKIKEVTVDKGKHDYIRLTVYARQLTWMTDTLAKVGRGICHLYMKSKKKDGSPKVVLKSLTTLFNKDVLKNKNRKMTRAVLNVRPDMFMHFEGPGNVKQLPADSVKRLKLRSLGGNWGINYARFDWKNKRCDVVEDSVFFKKLFTIPLTRLAIGHMYRTETYDITYGAPKISNMTNYMQGFRVLHKPSNTSVDIHEEFFVLGVDYASKEDLEKDKEEKVATFEPSDEYPAFNENIQEAMKTMGKLTKEEIQELWYQDEKKK